MKYLRLIYKETSHVQTGPDSWSDTTSLQTELVSISDCLAEKLKRPGVGRAVIIGGELEEDKG